MYGGTSAFGRAFYDGKNLAFQGAYILPGGGKSLSNIGGKLGQDQGMGSIEGGKILSQVDQLLYIARIVIIQKELIQAFGEDGVHLKGGVVEQAAEEMLQQKGDILPRSFKGTVSSTAVLSWKKRFSWKAFSCTRE